jgi:formiminotetrahydrofolate cyclodeaminase
VGRGLSAAIAVPRAGVATAASLTRLLESLAGNSNPWLGSDLAIAADLAAASTRAFAWNVRVNLPQLEDQGEQTRIAEETSRLVEEARASAQRVEAVISSLTDA